MTLNEILTLTAIFTSPIVAVLITLWLSERKIKRETKLELFLTLISTRKSYPVPIEFVKSLNKIDVVFYKNNKVIHAWKELYNSYYAKPFQIEVADRKLLDLFDVMSKSLGYKNIRQTDFDCFYNPSAYQNKHLIENELYSELLRVLKNSKHFGKIDEDIHKDNSRLSQNMQTQS